MIIDNETVLILKSSVIGESEPDLGEKLMNSFLNVLLESDKIPARIICLSTAVFLTTEGSAVLNQLRRLENAGVEILSCETCLNYYERSDKLIVGKSTNMKETVYSMMNFTRILNP